MKIAFLMYVAFGLGFAADDFWHERGNYDRFSWWIKYLLGLPLVAVASPAIVIGRFFVWRRPK